MHPNKICGYTLIRHAWQRICSRRLHEAVIAALSSGRVVHTRCAVIYVIGRKEVAREAALGDDISEFEGTHVVCVGANLITAYRNRNLRGLKPRKQPNRKTFRRR